MPIFDVKDKFSIQPFWINETHVNMDSNTAWQLVGNFSNDNHDLSSTLVLNQRNTA